MTDRTDEGRRLIEWSFSEHARRISALFAPPAPEEQETLAALCRKLSLGAAAEYEIGLESRHRRRSP